MFCPNCGANIEGEERFCPDCGELLAQTALAVEMPEEQVVKGGASNKTMILVIALVAVVVLVLVAAIAVILILGDRMDSDDPDNEETVATMSVPTTTTEAPTTTTEATTTTFTTTLPTTVPTTVVVIYETVTVYSGGYDSSYIIPGSDSRYVTQYEADSMTTNELIYAINEIYARHGYIFNDADFANYFATKSWYYPSLPSSQFSTSMFNSYEQANVNLLKAERESRR